MHSRHEHTPQGPDTGLQDKPASADESETGDKATSPPSIAPVSTDKNSVVPSLALGRRVGPVDAVDAFVTAGDSDHGVASSDEEA